MKTKRIYIQQWLEFKPYQKQSTTDAYYLLISNAVKEEFNSKGFSTEFGMYLIPEDIDLLACFLTCYFEDIISENHFWFSFVRKHKELYGKALPFYDIDEDYDEREINVQDVSLLIWYFINTMQEGKFVSPYNDFITDAAEVVMEIFDEAWEYAPVNAHLKKHYQLDTNETDYYEIRGLIDKSMLQSYLFYPDLTMKNRDLEMDIMELSKFDENVGMRLSEGRDVFIHTSHTRLLALSTREWTAAIVGDKEALRDNILNISQVIKGLFFYKGQDGANIHIEHIASGKKFDVTKKSFDHGDTLKTIDSILYMGMVRWIDEWWFSGIFYQQDFDANIVLDEKNSIESRMQVNFLDHQNSKTDEVIASQHKSFLEFNNGSPIAFLPADKVEPFLKSCVEHYVVSLNLTEQDRQDAKQRARDEGFFGFDKGSSDFDFSQDFESGLVFFNPKSGVEAVMSINSAFPMDNNPYYVEANSREHVLQLLVDKSTSAELVMYCIDHCSSKLPFFEDDITKAYIEDIDFLLRFWKASGYHAKPEMTITGR